MMKGQSFHTKAVNLVQVWKDKWVVHVISTIHDSKSANSRERYVGNHATTEFSSDEIMLPGPKQDLPNCQVTLTNINWKKCTKRLEALENCYSYHHLEA
jgi:hypothetical protein